MIPSLSGYRTSNDWDWIHAWNTWTAYTLYNFHWIRRGGEGQLPFLIYWLWRRMTVTWTYIYHKGIHMHCYLMQIHITFQFNYILISTHQFIVCFKQLTNKPWCKTWRHLTVSMLKHLHGLQSIQMKRHCDRPHYQYQILNTVTTLLYIHGNTDRTTRILKKHTSE